MTKEELNIIDACETFVRDEIAQYDPGHDWSHIERVMRNALTIAEQYQVNELVLRLAVLLHDVGDAKFHEQDQDIGQILTTKFFDLHIINQEDIDHILRIILNMSFKSENLDGEHSIEFQIIQDADRLDAIGAVGIGRAFSYGGFKKRPMFDPNIPPVKYKNKEEYQKIQSPTLNHLHEKLYLLKDLMNTKEARKIAEERHNFMLEFENKFKQEWAGKTYSS